MTQGIGFANPLDMEMRCLQARIRHDHAMNAVAVLDTGNLVALLVEQVGCALYRQSGQDASGIFFQRFFFEQA